MWHRVKNITRKNDQYCMYYQAYVERSRCWFVVALLKSYEHMSFDRTIDNETSRFEFFVPSSTEQYFLEVMEHLSKIGLVSGLEKLSNRLIPSC